MYDRSEFFRVTALWRWWINVYLAATVPQFVALAIIFFGRGGQLWALCIALSAVGWGVFAAAFFRCRHWRRETDRLLAVLNAEVSKLHAE